MPRRWPFTKPVGLALSLFPQTLTDTYRQLGVRSAVSPEGYRFSFRLQHSADILINISSEVANQKGWHRAGYLATVQTGAPIDAPVQSVDTLYFGQQYLSFVWTGLDGYFEFWPHLWITDYQIEIWAKNKVAIAVVLSNPDATAGNLLFFDTETGTTEAFTFFGDLINFP